MPGATEKLLQVTGGAVEKNLSAASAKGQGSLFNLAPAKCLSSLTPVAKLLSCGFSCPVLAELRVALHDTVTFQLSHYLVPTKSAAINVLAVVVLNRFSSCGRIDV